MILLRDLLGGLVLAIAAIVAVLALLLRNARLALLSLPPNLMPLLLAGAYMVLRDIPLNLTTAMTFAIGFGLAVDDTIHLLARFREEARTAASADAALTRAAGRTGKAIVITSVTLALGFSVMTLSELLPVRLFGELIVVLVLSALVTTLLLLPAMLKRFGSWALAG